METLEKIIGLSFGFAWLLFAIILIWGFWDALKTPKEDDDDQDSDSCDKHRRSSKRRKASSRNKTGSSGVKL